jgi:hypothetical protein
MIDDEKDRHPFYSDWGIKQFEKRKKEMIREEEETAKINARKARGKSTAETVETDPIGYSAEQVRDVWSDQGGAEETKILPKLPSHNRKKVQATAHRHTQRNRSMPNVPQVRHRKRSPRKPNKDHNVVVL